LRIEFGRPSLGAAFFFLSGRILEDMKRTFLPRTQTLAATLILTFLAADVTWSQSAPGFPYNPDANGNESIETGDLIQFLTYFGSSFLPSGVLPVEGGGTGVSTVDSARVVLSVSTYEDVIPAGQTGARGQVNGSLNISQSLAQGFGTSASGSYAQAQGRNTTASGAYSFASNQNSVATGVCSSAIGEGSSATATAAHAQGLGSAASGIASHAEGYQTDALSSYSHSEGYRTEASNTAAHAEGYQTTADGLYSHAENRNTTASATCAHAEGEGTSATADAAHSEGFQTLSSGFAAHAEGYQTVASGQYSHASGRGSAATASSSAAVGYNVVADQENSTAVGQWNLEGQTGVLFAVGNGADVDNRSDAFQVDNLGNVTASGKVIASGQDLLLLITTLQNQVDSLNAQVAEMQSQIDALGGN
jgi:hypothetical protein